MIGNTLQKLLLRTQDGSGSDDAEPGDGDSCGNSEFFHQPESDKRAGAAESGLAVDGHQAFTGIGNFQESTEDASLGTRPVREDQIVVI